MGNVIEERELPKISRVLYRELVKLHEELASSSLEKFNAWKLMDKHDAPDKENFFQDFLIADAEAKGAFRALRLMANNAIIVD